MSCLTDTSPPLCSALYYRCSIFFFFFLFFFNDTATTEIYTLSLHDALPISEGGQGLDGHRPVGGFLLDPQAHPPDGDRKSTRLNSSHVSISYAVFCLKKKKKKEVIST